MQTTVGMYGDQQGIAGKMLQEIDRLSLKVLEAPNDATVDNETVEELTLVGTTSRGRNDGKRKNIKTAY